MGGLNASTGTFNLGARVDDAADDIATTDSVTVDGSRTGSIDGASDADYFRIDLAAGQNYTFDVVGNSLNDPTLTLRNSGGTQLAFNDDTNGLDPQIGWTSTYSGAHFLQVDGLGSDTGSYTLFG